jgi:hypothetical protein
MIWSLGRHGGARRQYFRRYRPGARRALAHRRIGSASPTPERAVLQTQATRSRSPAATSLCSASSQGRSSRPSTSMRMANPTRRCRSTTSSNCSLHGVTPERPRQGPTAPTDALRSGQRRGPRTRLRRIAHDAMNEMGIGAFAERARREFVGDHGATSAPARRCFFATAHCSGAADRATRQTRSLESRDRRPPLPEPAHPRVAPSQHLREGWRVMAARLERQEPRSVPSSRFQLRALGTRRSLSWVESQQIAS